VKTTKVPNPPEAVCARCHHTESEHGKTGSRPCLAMIGDLLTREFCACNEFKEGLRKAA
jgi:cytochrome c553